MPRLLLKGKAVRKRKLLPGQTFLAVPKRPTELNNTTTDVLYFLGVQATAFVQARRLGASESQARRRFETACRVEFKLPRELDEDEPAYIQRSSERLKVFWWPALKWAVDRMRYRRVGSAFWLAVDVLDANVPMPPHGPRPRPRPAYRQKPAPPKRDASPNLKSRRTTKKIAPSIAVPAEASTSTSTSTSDQWPSAVTLAKFKNRSAELFSSEEIREMEAVAVMLRAFEDERLRAQSPEL